MKKNYWKMILRTVRRSRNRFLALLAITALGVGFLTGLLCTAPDMKNSVDQYYDEADFMDIDIKSTLGLTADDLEAVRAVDGTESAAGVYAADVLACLNSGESGAALVIGVDFSAQDCVNSLSLQEGRLPENAGECVQIVENPFSEYASVGDRVTLLPEEDDDLYRETEFTVVGLVTSPLFVSTERESSSVGAGTVNFFFCVPIGTFDTDIYTDFYVTLRGAAALDTFSDEYTDLVDSQVSVLKDLGTEREQVRYENLRTDALREIDEAESEYLSERADAEAELAEAEQELSDGRQEIEDGEAEAAQSEQELADALREIEDGESALSEAAGQLEEAWTALVQAREELDGGWAELNGGKSELDEASGQIEEIRRTIAENETEIETARQSVKEYDDGLAAAEAGRAELASSREELDAGWASYEEGLAALAEAEEELAEAGEELTQARSQLDEGWKSYGENEKTLEEAAETLSALEEAAGALKQLEAAGRTLTEEQKAVLAAYEEGKASYQEGTAALAEAKAQLEAGEAEYEAGRTAYEESLPAAEASIEEAETELTEAKAQLEAGEQEYEAGLAQIEAAEEELAGAAGAVGTARAAVAEWDENLPLMQEAVRTYEDSLAEYERGREELLSGEREYEAGRAEYETGVKEVEENRQSLADAREQVSEGTEALEEARRTLANARTEVEDGQAEYEDARASAQEQFAQAEQELADAREEVGNLSRPKWYVLNRETNASYYSFLSNADKVSAIAQVFPIFFFLVAALVALTTMTRMVEEERTEIGVMKALGFGTGAIAAKYLLYAGTASIVGAVAGVLLGQWIFPTVIWSAYSIMYYYPGFHVSFLAQYALPSAFASIGSVLIATMAAVFGALSEGPAQLMLPKAPKEGKRIFLEHLPFLWNRLKFTYKVTARNIFRYKQRFFMTIVGIAGCTALLVAGFGIRDSIGNVVHIQFQDIQKYTLTVTVDEDASGGEKETLQARFSGQGEESLVTYYERLTLYAGEESEDIYVEVPEDSSRFPDFIELRERTSGKAVPFDDHSVIITEKLADSLGVGIGDAVTLEKSDGTPADFTLTGITENYIWGYLYIGRSAWEEAYGESPECLTWMVQSSAVTGEEEDAQIEELLQIPYVASAQFSTGTVTTFNNMLNQIDYIVIVLILCAGLLAFVVLYNLININISERQREIATIKVLGFYDREVNAYIFRETFLLSIFGSLAGLVVGFFLHRFVILTVEVDYIMFGRSAKPLSYVYSVLITLAFTAVVSLFMSRKLKQISMVESLKSVD